MEELVFAFPWAFTSIAGVSLILQLYCLVHVIRSGRPYYWFWVILWFPFLGSLAYLFLEVKPRGLKLNWNDIRWRFTSPMERIRILREVFDNSPTMKNRYRLADELSSHGQSAEACDLLVEGMCGPFADDLDLMLRVTEAQLDCGRVDDAFKLVSKITPGKSSEAVARYQLIQARALSDTGRADEAEKLFTELMKSRRSEAPAYYYAQLLLHADRKEDANQVLHDILHRYRRGTTVWRYQEKRWYMASKQLLSCK